MEKAPSWPLIEIAIEPKSKGDREKLVPALEALTGDDPALAFTMDAETGQIILGSTDELQLDRAVVRLIQAFGIAVDVGSPQVAYRERLGRSVEVDAVRKQPAGPKSDFARVKLLFEPGEVGSGFQFEDRTADDVVPKEYIPGVIAGLKAASESGLVAGFPVIDFKAVLIGGAYHDVDSSAHAFP